MIRFAVLGFAMVMVAGSCGSGGSGSEGDVIAARSSSTTVAGKALPSAPTATLPATSAPPSTTVTVPGERVIEAVPADLPPVLVAGPHGIGVLGEAPLISPPGPDELGLWVSAIPDGSGGLVYAGAGDAAQIIWWWPAGEADARLASFKPGRVLRDVAVIDERLVAVVTDDPDPLDDDSREFLQLIDLEPTSGEASVREVGVVTEAAFAPLDVRYDGERFAMATFAHVGCGQLFAMGLDGQRSGLEGVPEPDCSPVPYSAVAIAPGGASFALLEAKWSAPSPSFVEHLDVVVYEEGVERFRFPVGQAHDLFDVLDFDGRWIIIGGPIEQESSRRAYAIVIDTSPTPIATRAIAIDVDGALGLRFLGDTPLSIPEMSN